MFGNSFRWLLICHVWLTTTVARLSLGVLLTDGMVFPHQNGTLWGTGSLPKAVVSVRFTRGQEVVRGHSTAEQQVSTYFTRSELVLETTFCSACEYDYLTVSCLRMRESTDEIIK